MRESTAGRTAAELARRDDRTTKYTIARLPREALAGRGTWPPAGAEGGA